MDDASSLLSLSVLIDIYKMVTQIQFTIYVCVGYWYFIVTFSIIVYRDLQNYWGRKGRIEITNWPLNRHSRRW